MDLPGALLLWATEHGLAEDQPVFFSRKRAMDGGLRAISREQAWEIVRAASGEPMYVSWRFAVRHTGKPASRLAYIRICSAMHGGARSCGRQRAYRLPRSKPAGVNCRWPI